MPSLSGRVGGLVIAIALTTALAIASVGCGAEDPVASRSRTTTSVAPSTSTTGASTTTSTTTMAAPAVKAVGASVEGRLTAPDGRERSHHVYAASSVTAAPDHSADLLVIALHGGNESGTEFESESGLDGWAEANHAVVVYPDGIGSGAQGSTGRTWNGGGCCGVAASQKVDDVAYVRLLIDQLASTYHVDPGHVVAIGYSNGGMLAYRLACEAADSVSAIGVQSSALERPTCSPTRSVSVLHIHGTDDNNLPIDGGVGSESSANITFMSPREGVKVLASAEGCAPQATEATDPANAEVLTRTWSPCAAGTVVSMHEVPGGGHAWMDDTSAVLWQFVTSHVRG